MFQFSVGLEGVRYASAMRQQEIWLIRHGETEWSKSGQHTSRTDVALTEEGERRASELGRRLAGHRFAAVWSSPMRRAIATARRAGFEPEIAAELREWGYGPYEGLTTAQIQERDPGWSIWTGAVPDGESAAEIARRADDVIARCVAMQADVALFSHGHFLRVLAARWLGWTASEGRLLALSTGSISILSYERTTRVIHLWNQTA